MGRLGCRNDAFRTRELDAHLEHLVLVIGDRFHMSVKHEFGQRRRISMLAEPTGVNGWRDEGVSQRVHRYIGTIGAIIAVSP